MDEDPDSPDGNWGAWDGNGDTSAHVSFPTPVGTLTTGTGLQQWRVLIRNDSAGSNSTGWSLEVWESGVLCATCPTATGSNPAEGGVVVTLDWDAGQLSDSSGLNVECALIQTTGGTGGPSARKGIEVGAFEWIAEVDAASTRNRVILVD